MEQEKELNLQTESELHVNVIGDGEAIVFLHGGPGSEHRFFLPHVLPLSQKFKLIFYDQRGCGKSNPVENNQYSMKGEIDALETLRKEMGIEKLNLFGESWGSMLALLYATSYPERVNKILLTAAIGVTTEGFSTFSKELENRLSKEDKIKLSNLEKKLKIGDAVIEDIFRVLDRYYVFSEESLKRKEKTTMNTIVNEAIGKDINENYNLTSNLDKIKNIPIVIAQGSHDILTPGLIKKLLLDHIPHAKLIEIEKCGHWTVVEKPNEIIEIANDFFEPALFS
ncbi:alpha/beta fold hydrolase [Alkalihalophilus marmarensis]|uniref:alpha/beta fold hydrolase n=1 Tax=Alkalihalophilus marmarensis TaxID=521377 RepID=UPI002DB97FD7|nr:alpha/beta hydrolase [Alkalihalophilus marmarensis]MEC2072439.1 alpha/beta hydrolase [Alkalihalophilus marmarensis]